MTDTLLTNLTASDWTVVHSRASLLGPLRAWSRFLGADVDETSYQVRKANAAFGVHGNYRGGVLCNSNEKAAEVQARFSSEGGAFRPGLIPSAVGPFAA